MREKICLSERDRSVIVGKMHFEKEFNMSALSESLVASLLHKCWNGTLLLVQVLHWFPRFLQVHQFLKVEVFSRSEFCGDCFAWPCT